MALEPVLIVFFLITKSRYGDVASFAAGWYGEYAVGGLFDEAEVIWVFPNAAAPPVY